MAQTRNGFWRRFILVVGTLWVLMTPYYFYHNKALPLWYVLLWGVVGVVGVSFVVLGRFEIGQWGYPAIQLWPWLQFVFAMVLIAATIKVLGQAVSFKEKIHLAGDALMLVVLFYAEGMRWVWRRLRGSWRR